MASNTPSAFIMPAANVPGLSENLRSLRRPEATNVFYSCTQQEWDALCQQTLVDQTRAVATRTLIKKSKAGVLHETAKGEPAQVKCSGCMPGPKSEGSPCYLKANSTVKTCGHCLYRHLKCDAQRASDVANNNLAISAPVTTLNQPGANNLAFSPLFTVIDQPDVVAPYDPLLVPAATPTAPVAMTYLEWLQIEYEAEMARLNGGAEMEWY